MQMQIRIASLGVALLLATTGRCDSAERSAKEQQSIVRLEGKEYSLRKPSELAAYAEAVEARARAAETKDERLACAEMARTARLALDESIALDKAVSKISQLDWAVRSKAKSQSVW